MLSSSTEVTKKTRVPRWKGRGPEERHRGRRARGRKPGVTGSVSELDRKGARHHGIDVRAHLPCPSASAMTESTRWILCRKG